tara:strand:+ start:2661 stop:2891 length:231 start_codon:yes stop_codon:yes gene_type:complete
MFLFINDFDPLKSYGREYGMFCVRAWAGLTVALIGIAATGSTAAAAFATAYVGVSGILLCAASSIFIAHKLIVQKK